MGFSDTRGADTIGIEKKQNSGNNSSISSMGVHPAVVHAHALLRDLNVEMALSVLETYKAYPPSGHSWGSNTPLSNKDGYFVSKASIGLSDIVITIVELINTLSSDLLVLQTARLCAHFIRHFHDHSVGVRPQVWSSLSSKCISVCKAHLRKNKEYVKQYGH